MSSEKRLILFVVLTFLSIMVIDMGTGLLGLKPPPAPAPAPAPENPAEAPELAKDEKKPDAEPIAKAKDETEEAKAKKQEPKKTEEIAKAEPPAAKKPEIPRVTPEELVLGSARPDQGPGGYLLELRLDQSGAGVAMVSSARYEAEFEAGKPKDRPLQILKFDPLAPASLTVTLRDPKQVANVDPETDAVAARLAAAEAEIPLDAVYWEVVRDDKGLVVHPLTRKSDKGEDVEGQEVVFRTRVDAWDLTITKTYRIWKAEEGFEVALTFESPSATRDLVYKLLGPHGVPIEGEWFTGTFRDAVFGLPNGSGTKVVTLSAYDIVKNRAKPERFQTEPLKFTGVENQYFASIVEPNPVPGTTDERWDAETVPLVLHEDAENKAKSDIGVEIVSKPITVGPNVSVTHNYRVFAGPKIIDSLRLYGAEDLASYRKSNWIPFAPDIARVVITPLLDVMYNFTRQVARLFGGKNGNYGVAIILLTMLVRLAMFPLGRKQAIMAKKMQDLQPEMKKIQDEYKDDKEELSRQTWALYKRHKVNPVSGCLPALLPMPIFVGLWQSLNNSVFLRHARFLYIENLAAPDMLFKFPFEMPSFIRYYIGDYFNLLPFLVVSLMLVQTKLFSPPPTTPEAETQQKTMKFMMIIMAFMFYKVPSGLGIYFITSSLWQISERLLLPKVKTKAKEGLDSDFGPGPDDDRNLPGNDNSDGGGRGPNGSSPKPPGKFGQFWEKVLQEAAKNPTYRNLTEEKGQVERDRDGGKDRDRDRGKPRSRPGRKR
jgi:YidC/Oxa1 family membrane protein insertase